MTRKRLPKAIRPANLVAAQAAVGAVDDSAGSTTPSASEKIEPEWTQRLSSNLPANDVHVSISFDVQKLAARRRALANRIVESHGLYAALSGLAPLPAVNVAGVAAIILRMLKQLSGLYQIRFERDRTRSFVLAVLGGAAPAGLGAATVSTISLIAPAPAFVGLAVSALTADALTRAIGEVFVESFERQAPLR
jgi:uncharacterized protein (DUF697 family)